MKHAPSAWHRSNVGNKSCGLAVRPRLGSCVRIRSAGGSGVLVLTVVVVLGVALLAAYLLLARNKQEAVLTPRITQPSATNIAVNHTNYPAPGAGKAKDQELAERINQANRLLKENKPADALELLQQAAKIRPTDEDVHYNLGIALSRLGRNDEALAEYQEALRLYPEFAEVQNNLGNLLLRMKRPDEAVSHLEQATKITPDYAAAWNNLGTALQDLGRTNDALEKFQKAVKLDTNYWQAHFNLGSSFVQHRQFDDARAEFETVLRLQPDFAPARQALARLDEISPLGPVMPSQPAR